MLSYDTFKSEILKLPYGKKVAQNVYVLWDDLIEISPLLFSMLKSLHDFDDITVIKFFLDQFKVSFLSYPDFFEDPHPVLQKSVTLDLSSGKKRIISYEGKANPPILHRKETMISPNRSEFKQWQEITIQLENFGCFDDTKKIGFKLFWNELLQSKSLSYSGHQLIQSKIGRNTIATQEKNIERHKTAMARSDFSRPVQFLLKHGLLQNSMSFFDYGCGLGDDVRALQHNGYLAKGWDPVHAPKEKKQPADIVNLGFVLNVIEKPRERIEVLNDAFSFAKKVLCIAVVTDASPTATEVQPYGDGYLTSRQTFQKYFKHDEIHELIEDVLNHSAHVVAPGIFYVFKNEHDAQDYLSSKQRRHINWDQLNLNVFPSRDERNAAKKELVYQTHRKDVEDFWNTMIDLGRLPTEYEFPQLQNLKNSTKMSLIHLQHWFVERYGDEQYKNAIRQRKDDLIVYLGLANFRKKIPFTHLSDRLQKDMKTFFGSYSQAQIEALNELFKIGNPEIIEKNCHTFFENTGIGELDDQALFLPAQKDDSLDPVLRMYVGVAGLLYGDVSDVDEIKIHKRSGKVTFLIYDDFETKGRDKLHFRIKVDLKNQKVYFFDHGKNFSK